MLHITNGESVAGTLRANSRLPGEVMVWKDCLHEGPTPAGLSLEEMSRVRARFIADCGWETFEEVLDDFRRGRVALEGSGDHEEIVLWFEHDLFDQLQLIQLLDWFAARDLGRTRL